MSQIEVRPVQGRRERETFLTFPWRIYRGDPLWVPPLLPDWRERMDPQKGVFFQRGEADFFIAWRDGQPVGTICAAEDRKANAECHTREAVFGFFNFIEDFAVMQALLAWVKDWALARGLNSLTGPFNLDYEDSYGILVDGRDRPPPLMCGHTPPYYLAFIERYGGFYPSRGQNLAFLMDLTAPSEPLRELARLAERVRARGRFTIRPADMAHWEDELERIYQLINPCLQHLKDHRPWPREVIFSSMAPFRKIADPELILFAEENGRTVGWLPGLPDLNEVFIHANGLRYPWDYLKLFYYMRRPVRTLTCKSILVLPEYWGTGVGFLLMDEIFKRARQRGYQWVEGSLTSDDNPRTPALGQRFGARIYKRIQVYRLDL